MRTAYQLRSDALLSLYRRNGLLKGGHLAPYIENYCRIKGRVYVASDSLAIAETSFYVMPAKVINSNNYYLS